MSSRISVVVVLLLSASAAVRKPPVSAVALPEAVLAHPVSDGDSVFDKIPWRSSAQAFASWREPWAPDSGLYDHRYVTW